MNIDASGFAVSCENWVELRVARILLLVGEVAFLFASACGVHIHEYVSA